LLRFHFWLGSFSTAQRKNLRILRALAEKRRESSTRHNLGVKQPNKEQKKNRVGSKRWCRAAELFGFALHDELKKRHLARREGRQPVTAD
jgi:hypothetical protein